MIRQALWRYRVDGKYYFLLTLEDATLREVAKLALHDGDGAEFNTLSAVEDLGIFEGNIIDRGPGLYHIDGNVNPRGAKERE